MTATEHQIQELRSAFFQKLERDGTADLGGFHEADLNRVKNTDKWLRRFLEHNDLDLNLSLNMLWESCEWRKQFGTNDISESNIKMEYIHDGCFFSHGRDVDGKALLIFKSKKHVKGQRDVQDLKRCLVYWLDRLEREENGDMITIFFDMADTGLNNMDMDFTKYIISLFKQYFPNFLNYIIIFEMPWILNAAFKVIKALLPAKAVAKMKFVNKGSLKEVVASDQALVCWGGRDAYEFSFTSEIRKDNIYNPQSKLLICDEMQGSKKVHFADGSPVLDSNESIEEKHSGEMLSITPLDTISFIKEGNEITGTITITNADAGSVTYKIKTTAPEKFRVRPSTGPLSPGASVTISVTLLPGYHATGLTKDKFLVMGIALPSGQGEMSTQEITDMWKSPSSHNVEQHRLKCILPELPDYAKNGGILSSGSDSKQNLTNVLNKLTELVESNKRLQEQVSFVQTMQWVMMVLLLLFAVVFIYMFKNESDDSQKICLAD